MPDPVAAIVTRWGSDPWSGGAVSFLPPGAGVGLRAALARPIGDRLFFVGEATSVEDAGTVRGAWLEGHRAGDAVRSAFGDGARVVVVGAGMAGVAATRRLSDTGSDVVTLEARARVGGRIFTERRADSAPVDLGAGRIGGRHGDPIVALLDELRLPRRVVGNGEVLRAEHRRESDVRITALNTSFRRLVDGAGNVAAALGATMPADGSLAGGFGAVNRRWRSDDLLGWAVTTRIEHQYGTEVERLSVRQRDGGRIGQR